MISDEKKFQMLSVSNVFLLITQGEGLSIAVAEALCMGLKIVSTNVGGLPELVSPSCGTLVNIDEHEIGTMNLKHAPLFGKALINSILVPFNSECKSRIIKNYNYENTLQQTVHILNGKFSTHFNETQSNINVLINYYNENKHICDYRQTAQQLSK